VQLRPVRVERPDEELAPKRSEFAKRAGLPLSAFRGAGNGFCDGCHGRPVYFRSRLRPRKQRFPALQPIFGLIY
jgi:hypothetical protein